jgi:hypothetical protein
LPVDQIKGDWTVVEQTDAGEEERMATKTQGDDGRVAILRAEFYEDEAQEYSTPTGIHPLGVKRAGVITDVNPNRVTVSLTREVGDPYGIEFDLAPEGALKLAASLRLAATESGLDR